MATQINTQDRLVSLRLPSPLLDQIQDIADQTGRSRSEVIRTALENFAANHGEPDQSD